MTTLNYTEHDDGRELYGTAAMEASRLGGTDRYHRLRQLARDRGLNLAHGSDRVRAEALLMSEVGGDAKHARTFDEAQAAIVRDRGLGFSEHDRRTAALEVLKARPEWAQYGTRGRAAPEENARAMALRENAMDLMRSMDPLDPERAGRAWRAAVKAHPQLAPDYSPFSTRARRARG